MFSKIISSSLTEFPCQSNTLHKTKKKTFFLNQIKPLILFIYFIYFIMFLILYFTRVWAALPRCGICNIGMFWRFSLTFLHFQNFCVGFQHVMWNFLWIQESGIPRNRFKSMYGTEWFRGYGPFLQLPWPCHLRSCQIWESEATVLGVLTFNCMIHKFCLQSPMSSCN